MKAEAICPACGSPLGSGATLGMCPSCLLGAGLEGADPDLPGEVDMIAEQPGDLVGRYLLVEKTGEGGFGVVFRAEQRVPVRRVVALKVIKPGMDSKEVVTRFEAERQALALMDHPNIARIHDGGMTGHGRPYFVMEFVEGQPLTDYCDERQLDIRQRLRLFAQICGAVQHAHQKGVIHRDLKPGNILVSEGEDGVPLPKVIDFGVAKAISIELTEKTFFTVFGRMVGTPLYMSPEQAELNAVDVDTRSDIYALGVVLYELLTGRPPLVEKHLTSASFDEMRRMIREEEPLKPSSRVMSLTDNARRATATVRGIDPAKFRRLLSGDLDWIVMKALEKDRTRRYDTAHGVAVDVRRYLRGLPVNAGPPGAAYRIGKFVRRHRWGVAATLLALAALIGEVVRVRKDSDRIHEEMTKVEHERLKSLVAGVHSRHREEAGSREAALKDLREIGFYPLEEIGVTGDPARKLRADARNELIECLDWTDLQKKQLLGEELKEGWVEAALDSTHEHCVLFEEGWLKVRAAFGGEDLAARPGLDIPVKGSLQFNPDGDRVAAGFGSPEVWKLMIWSWEEDRVVVEGVPGVHAAFDFHPGGDGFAVGTPDRTIEIRNRDGVVRPDPLVLSVSPVVIRFSPPDGLYLALGTKESGVMILEVATGKKMDEWPGVAAVSLAWAPDGRSLVAGGAYGSVTVLERGPPNVSFSVKGKHEPKVDEVAWSPDGSLIASGGGDEIRLWDGRQGQLLCEYAAWARTLSFSNDNKSLGPVFSALGVLSALEVQRTSPPVCYRAVGHPGKKSKITAAAWGANGGVLATAAEDGVRLWNWKGALLKKISALRVRPGGLAGSAAHFYFTEKDGISRLEISISEKGLHCGDPELLSKISDGEQILLSPPGSPGAPYLAVARDGEVVLLDVKTTRVVQRLEAPPSTAFVAISPDGAWLAAGTRHGTGVRVWRLGPPVEKVWDLPVPGAATVAFHPKMLVRPLLMTGNATDYRLWSWDAAATKLDEGPVHKNKMASERGLLAQMVISPRGTVAVVSYDRKFLRVLHSTKLTLMTQPRFDEQWPLAISPDGRMMATEGANGQLYIWDLAEIVKELEACGLDWRDVELPGFAPRTAPLAKP